MPIKTIFFLALLLMTASCSSIYGNKGVIRNRNTDYLQAKSIPPLKIPPGLSSSTIQASYPVPDKNYSDNDKDISLLPPGLN